MKCSQRAPLRRRQVARASQRLTGPWRPQRHVEPAPRGCTVLVPLSALKARAAEPSGRQRAASSATGRTIAGRSSDLLRTLFHPRKGVECPHRRRHRARRCFGHALGPWGRRRRRSSSRTQPKQACEWFVRRARPGNRYTYVSAHRCACRGVLRAVELSTAHTLSIQPKSAANI